MSKLNFLRMTFGNMLSIALFPVIAASMCSCQKELTYASENNERHVDISFKWNNNNRKSNMAVWIFPTVGAGLFYSLPTDKVSNVEAQNGQLHAFCYNNDSDINRFEVNAWKDAIATTGETDIVMKSVFGDNVKSIPRGGDPDEPICFQPTELYCDTCTITGDDDSLITFTPQPVLKEIEIRIVNVKGTNGIAFVSAALSGMASSMSLSTLKPCGCQCTIPIGMSVEKESVISGNGLSFGKNVNYYGKNILTIYVMLSDGQRIYYNYDISDRISQTANKTSIEVTIEGMTVPEVQAGSGFNPNLNEWNIYEEEIAM